MEGFGALESAVSPLIPTEYIDVLAEEDTRITESLIVTQSGLFSCPVAGTECLYAPHYRANDGARPQLETDKSGI